MTCHASTVFLAEQHFEAMYWPGNSTDLNTIENGWNQM
jgi:hypothetical protein